MILKSFCDGVVSVTLKLNIDFNEKEIRLEVTSEDLSVGRGDSVSFDASEFADALKYYDTVVEG